LISKKSNKEYNIDNLSNQAQKQGYIVKMTEALGRYLEVSRQDGITLSKGDPAGPD
jgi:hypothetical protein